ncbi:hypothetical protein [Umezawaea sp. Da 62-37]|uniref:hypothetical protein n=1 Tax=Umezawaea sp. Da 62-37 TaxID=3075927 RepID=UPI0028F6D8E8|nr:hypothetical protein [Umezawaea sp. Da 62-37]WNV83930.1 hypothetical protein RM788_38065 [Umezawaea sp. Da 62-37]
MLSLRRVVVAGVIAVPMVIGGAGVALADGFQAHEEAVGPDGVSADYVAAHESGPHFGHFGGNASYVDVSSSTGPEGPTNEWILAAVDEYGNTLFDAGRETAGPQGVSSGGVSANTTGHRG